MERKLNEQWVEEIDGKKHMLKAAGARSKGHVCNGCAFNNGTCDYQGDECPVPKGCYQRPRTSMTWVLPVPDPFAQSE